MSRVPGPLSGFNRMVDKQARALGLSGRPSLQHCIPQLLTVRKGGSETLHIGSG
jgi:hypothetical protein